MAQVDFSNAVIESVSGYNPESIREANVGVDSYILDSSGGGISTATTLTVLSESLYSKSIRLTGTFTASGTELYIAALYYQHRICWRVSNISFSSGDNYNFIVDISLTIG